jgi:hypothetical protein
MADPAVRQRFQPPHTDTDVDAELSSLVDKEYVCRVVGEFPEGSVIVKEPILQSAGKVMIDSAGKSSETRFVRKWYDPSSNSSLVSCTYPEPPHTRTRTRTRTHTHTHTHTQTSFCSFFPCNRCPLFRASVLKKSLIVSSRLFGYRTTAPDPSSRCTLATPYCE